MGIANDWMWKKKQIDPNMPGQQVHVHLCKFRTLHIYRRNNGNVLEEIGCMGGVVGSGHAY